MSTTTHILAIRHGETAWNRSGRYQGQADVGLNDAGLAQACQIAQALADTNLDAIYTSDLARAHQTAAALADRLGMSTVVNPALREQHFGVFQGLTGTEIAQRWPHASENWHRRLPEFGPEGGESRAAFYQRCVSAMESVAAAHPGGVIAVVCHGGVLDCLYRAATGLAMDVPRTWSLDNAAINRLTYSDGRLALQAWGETAHLERSALDEAIEHFPAP